MTLYFLNYNNYYNRTLKKAGDKVYDYGPHILEAFPNINFIPNDGITTTQIVNWPAAQASFPDYMFAWDDMADLDLTMTIHSRWFVIESKRTRSGQYEMTLYRDLLADYYDELLDAPIFVEKGPLPYYSPLLFNSEDMTVNQIRKVPNLLYDKSYIPWVVGYIPQDAIQENTTITKNIGISADEATFEVDSIDDWEYSKYLDQEGALFWENVVQARYNTKDTKGTQTVYKSYLAQATPDAAYPVEEVKPALQSDWENTYTWADNDITQPDITVFRDNLAASTNYINGLSNFIYNYRIPVDEVDAAILPNLAGKILKDKSTNQYYEIECIYGPLMITQDMTERYTSFGLAIRDSFLNSFINRATGKVIAPTSGTQTYNTFSIQSFGTSYQLKLKQVFLTVQTTIGSDRYHLEDQPFDMFCIPYGPIDINNDYDIGFTANAAAASIATAIAEKLGSGAIYDLQILPYCPIPYVINDDGYINPTGIKHSLIYDITQQDPVPISALFWCRKSSFTVEIPEFDIQKADNSVSVKLNSQTKKYRLVSPNYNGIFEFDPEKNGGVSAFKADCTYKPFNPFIRVYPVFGELYGYGGQYDARGLILGGDFSLPRVETAWANYQEQNKNYQAIFDRQIESLEIQNKYQRINDIFTSIAGAGQAGVSGGISGAMMGGMAGSAGGGAGMGIGAAIGGAIGIGMGAFSGVADVAINEALRKENIDLTKDQFGYNLGNIQAIPTSLTKSSTLAINNPLVPMLEVYECSQQETDAYINKLRYNGFTVMTIGTMGEYINNPVFGEGYDYFKGKLIRLEGIADDTHIINAIAAELNKGVYL